MPISHTIIWIDASKNGRVALGVVAPTPEGETDSDIPAKDPLHGAGIVPPKPTGTIGDVQG